ncbi:MAG: hypothetical protein V4710_19835 [Verrucomicrobiota bacterium]
MIPITLICLGCFFLLGWKLTINGLLGASEGYEDMQGFHPIAASNMPLEPRINPHWIAAVEEMLTAVRTESLPDKEPLPDPKPEAFEPGTLSGEHPSDHGFLKK